MAGNPQAQVLAKFDIFSLVKEGNVYKVLEDRFPYIKECSQASSAEEAVLSCWKKWIDLSDQTEWIYPTHRLWHLLKQIKPEMSEEGPIGYKIVLAPDAYVDFEIISKDDGDPFGRDSKLMTYITQEYFRDVIAKHPNAFRDDFNEGRIVIGYEKGLEELERIKKEYLCVVEKRFVYYCIRTH